MSISGFKRSARERIRDNALKLIIVTIVYLVIITVLANLYIRVSGLNDVTEGIRESISGGKINEWVNALDRFRLGGILISLAIMLISPVLDVGFLGYCLKISRGGDGDYKDIFDGFALFGKIIMLSILTSIFTLLWSLLFVFPGIVAAYRYRQAYFILLDNPEMSALECIRESKRLMVGNKLDLFLLDLSFIGWNLLDSIVRLRFPMLPIVTIWLLPYSTIARANFYNYLIRYNPEAEANVNVI